MSSAHCPPYGTWWLFGGEVTLPSMGDPSHATLPGGAAAAGPANPMDAAITVMSATIDTTILRGCERFGDDGLAMESFLDTGGGRHTTDRHYTVHF